MTTHERKGFSNVVVWRVALNSPFSGMSSNAKHVGLSLANYMSEAGDQAYPAPVTLHEDATLAESTVRKALIELQRGGWIVKVRQGGGRGRTNEWASTIPDSFWERVEAVLGRETRRDTAAFRAARAVLRERARGLLEAPAASASGSPHVPPAEEETRRGAAPLGDEKPAVSDAETRRESAKNPPPHGAEVEDLEGSRKEQQQGAEVVDAAAAALDRDLRRHQVAADVRALALAEPDRTRAWLDVALREARDNIGGFLATGIRGGEWPSARGEVISAERKHERRVSTLRSWVERGYPEESYALVDEWRDLTEVERNEYRLLVDELVSEQLPEAPAASAEEAAA